MRRIVRPGPGELDAATAEVRAFTELLALLPATVAEDMVLAEAALAVGDPAAALAIVGPWVNLVAKLEEMHRGL
ncbi:MAG: hypothetical protein ACRD0S_11400 [Acidimicrobiales bacterium]